ncbi:FitA-like ribbon-helix-helix domain-containing protein [Methylocystis sp. JAN1]|uniref:FitA-like ribbon-helix-helix domain-containing protein n=1 Tax=Methylocystis sp. JAN1 TaxID=3397211 RepID=UPI003FA1B61F
MSDILVRNIPDDLKRQIEERARANKRRLSREIEALLKRALAAPRPSEYGLGEELHMLVPPELWTDDFIQPRDNAERPGPDFE